MYNYYQDGEHSPWKVTPSKPKLLEELAKNGAKRCSILSVSEIIEPDTDVNELRHKGPLYFDIDCDDNLDKAADSARELVSLLKDYGVAEADIEVFASGSKGFHVVVPAEVFSTGRPVKGLPKIYARMARELFVPGMDFSVYSGRKGNVFRIPNVQRDDGNYRIPLLLNEVREIDSEMYRRLVVHPRPQLSLRDGSRKPVKSAQLEALFQKCKKQPATEKNYTSKVVEEDDLAQFRESPPACLEAIAEGKSKNSANFNQIALQFGSFVARAGVPERIWKPLANRAAENTTSNSYDTDYKRRNHLEAQVRYAQATKTIQFSCAAMRTVVDSSVCEGCPLYEMKSTETMEAGLELGIEERETGYFLLGKESDRQISNFILAPANECIEYGQDEGRWKRVGTQMDVYQRGEFLTTTMFDEHAWATKGNFIREVEGLKDLSFIGGDADVQRIKTLVYKRGREMGEIVRVYSAGIHAHTILGREVMVYVEPGFSVNALKIKGTHELQGTIQAPPKIASWPLPQNEKERKAVSREMMDLMSINSDNKIAQLLGWFVAAHLRTHFQRAFSQFPILSIWGAAGAGKSKQTELLSQLSGADYIMENSIMNVSNITPFALLDYCSTTTTVPRILDELNKTKMPKNKYNQITETIKASWGMQTVAKGTVGRGANGSGRVNASTVAIPVSSPIVIIGEQNPDIPAIQQRSVEVLISKEERMQSTEPFMRAKVNRKYLQPVAKALVLESLKTSTDWVAERIIETMKEVPEQLLERPQYSYAVLLLGLDFLKSVARKMELSDEVITRIGELRDALKAHLRDEQEKMVKVKAWSEVDSILYDVGMMVTMSQTENTNLIMVNRHLMVKGRYLYLDTPVVYALYKQYKRHNVVVDNPNTFMQLLSNEEYFAGQVAMPAMVRGRDVTRLNLEAMESKGHVPSLFQPGVI